MNRVPNQRKFTRVPIGYRVKVMAEERTIACPSAINLSMNGILVRAPEGLPLGTSCYVIIFVLEDGVETKILAWGTVVRENAEGMAIRFAKILGHDGANQLRKLVLLKCADPESAKSEFESFVRQVG
jgi:hypothetical protein